MQKILFIDRDGTLVKEPDDYQVDALLKIKLIEDVIPCLLKLQAAGYRLVMVSNQDGLGGGSFPQADFTLCHDFILNIFSSQGIEFDDILICPHFETDNCQCRKPKLGLLMDYITERRFDLEQSYVIGDRQTDLQLATNMKIPGILLTEKFGWQQVCTAILEQPRVATINRNTKETQIQLQVNLDNHSVCDIETPCHFLNHMLEQISRHALIGLQIKATGDFMVDDHHLVEDIAICLGQAIDRALGDKRGIERYGFTTPMDESLAQVAIDMSGRGECVFKGEFSRERVNDLSTEMIPHFFKTLAQNMKASLHLNVTGENNHHMIEACFKAFPRALLKAIAVCGNEVSSTKGCL